MTSATSDEHRAWLADRSVWSLVAANLLVLALALHQHWSFGSLLVLYWMQSVVIGVATVCRILSLERFSTENFTINNQRVDPTPEVRRKTAWFFAVHYGFFHLVYLGFIVGLLHGLWNAWILGGAVLFVLNQAVSYPRHRELDRQGTPNIGSLMFLPYIRILPMHAIILSGALVSPAGWGIVLFALLKTAADVAMHIVEHWLLRKARVPAAAAAAPASPLRAPPPS